MKSSGGFRGGVRLPSPLILGEKKERKKERKKEKSQKEEKPAGQARRNGVPP